MLPFLNLLLILLLAACSNQNSQNKILLEKDAVIAVVNQLFISTDNRL